MTIQQNTDRIQTTHIGSLPRPHDLLDMMKAKFTGEAYDQAALDHFAAQIGGGRRAQAGRHAASTSSPTANSPSPASSPISRSGWRASKRARTRSSILFQKEVEAFPEYYAEYFKEAMMGGTIVPISAGRLRRPGEISRREGGAERHRQRQGRREGRRRARPIMSFCRRPRRPASASTSTTRPTKNISTRSRTRCRKEYKAIIDAGILLQVDDPFLPDIFVEPGLDDKQMKRRAEIYVEAINVGAQGHSGRTRALPYLLRHQRRPTPLRSRTRRTSSNTCSRSTPAPTASKRPTRATSTSITCSRA